MFWSGKQRRAQWEKDSQIKAHRQEYQDWLKETGYATTEDEVDAAYAENPRWAP